jgi:hypothetical protein
MIIGVCFLVQHGRKENTRRKEVLLIDCIILLEEGKHSEEGGTEHRLLIVLSTIY